MRHHPDSNAARKKLAEEDATAATAGGAAALPGAAGGRQSSAALAEEEPCEKVVYGRGAWLSSGAALEALWRSLDVRGVRERALREALDAHLEAVDSALLAGTLPEGRVGGGAE